MNLSDLRPPDGQTHAKKRVGRGMGSGHGKTSTRGSKGQRAVSGFSLMRGFEGGQMPLHRRLPKRGFTNIFKKQFAIVNVSTLEEIGLSEVTPEVLLETGVIKKLGDGLKVLADGELKRAVNVTAHVFSKAAAAKIVAAGGTATVLGGAAAE